MLSTTNRLKLAENRVCGVYALEDPRDGRVRYVGSSVHVLGRYRCHCTTGSNSADKKRFTTFVLPLRAERKFPILFLLEAVPVGDRDRLLAAERKWIEHYRARGEADLNLHTKQGKQGKEITLLKLKVAALEAENELLRAAIDGGDLV